MCRKDNRRLKNVPIGVMFSADNKLKLIDKIEVVKNKCINDKNEWLNKEYTYKKVNKNHPRIVFVAKNYEDFIRKIDIAKERLICTDKDKWEYKDIMYRNCSVEKTSKLALIFPGQGSQDIYMMANITANYTEMRRMIQKADEICLEKYNETISNIVYPNCYTKEDLLNSRKKLKNTKYTQIVLAAINGGLYNIAKIRGLEADYVIGHSFGELTALYSAGVFDEETLFKLSIARGSVMSNDDNSKTTAMTAIMASREYVNEVCFDFDNVTVANENCPRQIVISGELEQIKSVENQLRKIGINFKRLNVSNAFHSKYMDNASKEFKEILKKLEFKKGADKVISNFDADFYENSKKDICKNLSKQISNPVLFQSGIEKAYEEGVRIFVEVGFGKTHSSMVNSILKGKDPIVIPFVPNKKVDSLYQMEMAFAKLCVIGKNIKGVSYEKEQIGLIGKNDFLYSGNSYFMLWSDKKNDKEKEDDIMGIDKIQELNATVLEKFIDMQKEQLKFVEKITNNKSITDDERRNLLDYMKDMQRDSFEVLDMYFENQRIRFLDEKSKIEGNTKKELTDNEVKKKVRQIVSEHTGCPENMIEESMKLEELGINSVKKAKLMLSIHKKFDEILSGSDFKNIVDIITVEDMFIFISDIVARNTDIEVPEALSREALEPMDKKR